MTAPRFTPQGPSDIAPAPGRTCGGCEACCELVAVKELNLRSFVGCPHRRGPIDAKGPGCGIYADRPHSCQSWVCLWLTSPTMGDELRPDRLGGIVLDQVLDLVRLNGKETVAAQVWVKPGREEAFKTDPRIGSLMLDLLNHPGIGAVLWRTSPTAALVIAPDPVTGKPGYSRTVFAEDSDLPTATMGTAVERLNRAAELYAKAKR